MIRAGDECSPVPLGARIDEKAKSKTRLRFFYLLFMWVPVGRRRPGLAGCRFRSFAFRCSSSSPLFPPLSSTLTLPYYHLFSSSLTYPPLPLSSISSLSPLFLPSFLLLSSISTFLFLLIPHPHLPSYPSPLISLHFYLYLSSLPPLLSPSSLSISSFFIFSPISSSLSLSLSSSLPFPYPSFSPSSLSSSIITPLANFAACRSRRKSNKLLVIGELGFVDPKGRPSWILTDGRF